MALTFQRSLTYKINNLQLFSQYLHDDPIIGGEFESVLFYKYDQDLIKLKFSVNLDEDGVLHLDSLIANYHETLPEDVKIYRLMNPIERNLFGNFTHPPFGWNYKTGLQSRLHFKDTKVFGRITERNYYAQKTIEQDGSVTLSDKVIREQYLYSYTEFGDVYEREIRIFWIKEDETEHESYKQFTKNYLINPEEMINESIRVREAFVNDLKIIIRSKAVPSMIVNGQITQAYTDLAGGDPLKGPYEQSSEIQKIAAELMAIALLEQYENEISSFISMGSPSIITAFAIDQNHVWLDNIFEETISFRQYMVEQFTAYIQGGAYV